MTQSALPLVLADLPRSTLSGDDSLVIAGGISGSTLQAGAVTTDQHLRWYHLRQLEHGACNDSFNFSNSQLSPYQSMLVMALIRSGSALGDSFTLTSTSLSGGSQVAITTTTPLSIVVLELTTSMLRKRSVQASSVLLLVLTRSTSLVRSLIRPLVAHLMLTPSA